MSDHTVFLPLFVDYISAIKRQVSVMTDDELNAVLATLDKENLKNLDLAYWFIAPTARALIKREQISREKKS
ncbi:MAG: hypothetical protein IT345_10780 [Trueperaceae bacterium]|nr:hypothetical protein [Trueperaceae bacterium]